METHPPQEGETDDALTGRFRVLQRKRGHRYSLDDVLTAREALRAVRRAGLRAGEGATVAAHLDLGCGLGSVLLMCAHHLEATQHVGIEAQAISFDLVTRNVARNGLGDRVTLHHGDLRDEATQTLARATAPEGFDLVTGTPPYAPPGTATPSPDPQRAFARVEMRGGIEDYLAAAAALVRPDGHVVVCGAATTIERARQGARDAELDILRRVDAHPREGRPPLFCVWTLAPRSGVRDDREVVVERFVARDAAGARTDAYFDLRAFFGLPAERR